MHASSFFIRGPATHLNSLLPRVAGQLPRGYDKPAAAIKHGPAVSTSRECPEPTPRSDSVKGTPLFSGKTSVHTALVQGGQQEACHPLLSVSPPLTQRPRGKSLMSQGSLSESKSPSRVASLLSLGPAQLCGPGCPCMYCPPRAMLLVPLGMEADVWPMKGNS